MFYSITCPYCRFAIQPLEACVICTNCRRVQHKACWEANSRCASEGCTGEPQEWRPDETKPRATAPALAAVPARGKGVTWPVSAALPLLIVWAVYQCLMLAHESGRWGHHAQQDLRLVSGHASLLRRPEPNAPVLAELPARSEVQVLSVTKDFVRVQTSSGQVGYVPRNRLDLPPPPKKKPN